jgi:L-arabinokinase
MSYRIEAGSTHGLVDTEAFLERLNRQPGPCRRFDLDPKREIILARAPGRLDLMGGIADYSGSLVLQLPIAQATHTLLQRHTDPKLIIVSQPADPNGVPREFEISLSDFESLEGTIEYQAARARFSRDPADHWAAYVAGAFLVLMRERGVKFDEGARILISSQVPEGKGVSSSASLEVSVMQAVVAAYGIEWSPREMAFACQKVENLVAGAPCGVMDQMTAACGEADRLLVLLCQPGELIGTVKLPDQLAVWGIDSGIRHAVTGADYGTVRTAAFMGYRIIAEQAGLPVREAGRSGLVAVQDSDWHGYLANLTPADFESSFAAHLPMEMSGADFLRLYRGITDPVTSINADRSYPVYRATRHPIYEHARVKRFAELLDDWREDDRQWQDRAAALGELMYQSDDSYSACGLGSAGTSRLVELVREAGREAGLYGAKITGGGSGGTVAVLGSRDAAGAVTAVAERYAESSGYRPLVISGSSPGAGAFGHLKLAKIV